MIALIVITLFLCLGLFIGMLAGRIAEKYNGSFREWFGYGIAFQIFALIYLGINLPLGKKDKKIVWLTILLYFTSALILFYLANFSNVRHLFV
jgi:hypothetical protein